MNWTKVGLKVQDGLFETTLELRLNWTKVGLKAEVNGSPAGWVGRLNWTKVGLKACLDDPADVVDPV